MFILTSVSDAALDASEDLLTFIWVTTFVEESATDECKCLTLDNRGEIPRGTGEVEGVGPGEGRGERVPITTARSSVQAMPRVWRNSSVTLSTTSSLVRCGTLRIRFTTCRET